MREQDLPSKHRPGGQRVPQHPARGLEACPDHQLHRLWSPVPLPRAQPGGSTQQGQEFFIFVPFILHNVSILFTTIVCLSVCYSLSLNTYIYLFLLSPSLPPCLLHHTIDSPL